MMAECSSFSCPGFMATLSPTANPSFDSTPTSFEPFGAPPFVHCAWTLRRLTAITDAYADVFTLPPPPDIPTLDEAGARGRINSRTRPPDVKEIEKTIATIRVEKEAAIKLQDYEKAAALRDSEQHTKDKLERILNGWREQRDEREMISPRGQWCPKR